MDQLHDRQGQLPGFGDLSGRERRLRGQLQDLHRQLHTAAVVDARKGTNPPAPTYAAYLRFVYGWVPFNVAAANTSCSVPDLPTISALSRAPIDCINLQYNFQESGSTRHSCSTPTRN
jgi:hypothetical protein